MFSSFGLFPPFFFLFFFFLLWFYFTFCSCFNYSFIFPNIFFIFLILFSLYSLTLYCFLSFFLSFLFFSFLFFSFLFFSFFLHHEACGILVPRPEVRPKLLWWNLQVQTTGLKENLRPQGILIRVRPRRGSHLCTKTRLYPTAFKIKCWTSQVKQPVRQEYSTTHPKKKKKETTKIEGEIGNLPEKEFRVMIVKMIQNLVNRMEKIQETFNKDLEELKRKQ